MIPVKGFNIFDRYLNSQSVKVFDENARVLAKTGTSENTKKRYNKQEYLGTQVEILPHKFRWLNFKTTISLCRAGNK